jgi:hypothetical protein
MSGGNSGKKSILSPHLKAPWALVSPGRVGTNRLDRVTATNVGRRSVAIRGIFIRFRI